MKKSTSLLLFIVLSFCFVFLLTACTQDEEPPTPQTTPQLATPVNVALDKDYKLTWDEVENASSYVVKIGTKENKTKTASFNFKSYSNSSATIYVKATGGLDYTDSEWATYEYEAPTTLVYTLLSDGSGYEVSRPDADDVNYGLSGKIVIPDYYQGLPVTRIADDAFSLRSLQIINPSNPNQQQTQQYNTVTTEIRLPEHLKEIGQYAFWGLTALKSIKLPDEVTLIDEYAFCGCSKLKTVTLNNGLTTIEKNAFNNTALTKINIPDSVTTIGNYAFYSCASMTKVTMTDSVTYIGSNAFASCKKLSDVTISENLQYMGVKILKDTAWYDNQDDGYVVLCGNILYGYKGDVPEIIDDIPECVKVIGGGAFDGCATLKSVTLHDGITLMPYAFRNCTGLIDVTLPSDIKVIPDHAFNGCTELKTIVIPKSVTEIGNYALFASGIERTVYYQGTQQEWESLTIGKNATSKSVLYFFSETQPTTEGNYWYYDADVNPTKWYAD